MNRGGAPDDSEERFRHVYMSHRTACIRYAARLMRGEAGTNVHILGVEAEEIYDEVMHRYYQDGEHLRDHDEHERNIKHRIKLRVISWLRKKSAARRTKPGQAVFLDAPARGRDGVSDEDAPRLDPPDPRAQDGEQRIDLTDALDRLPNPDDRTAAEARSRGDTYRQIAEQTGGSEENARQRVRRAAESLKDDP